jgi:hypothetical protein
MAKRPRQSAALMGGSCEQRHLACLCGSGANAVRLQLHALAYNLGNFLRTLAAVRELSATGLVRK